MGKLSGLACIAAGLAAAAYIFPLSENAPQATTGARAQSTPPAEAARTILQHSAQPGGAAPAQAARPAVTNPPAGGSKGEIVLRPIEPPQPARAARGGDEAKAALTRDIQKELKRVGCYSGDVTGEWGQSTRSAMKTFIDRVNASLPIDGPDFILKALVQGHPGNACGPACPSGQSMSAEGRCLPSAVVAQAARRPITPPAPQPVTQAPVRDQQPVQPPAPQQAQAQPAPAPTPAQRPATVASTWETRVFQAPAQQGAPAPSGRMAIGGPRGEPPVDTASTPAAAAGVPSTSAASINVGSINPAVPPMAGAVAASRPDAANRVAALPEQGGAEAAAVIAGAAGAAAAGRALAGDRSRDRRFAAPPGDVYRAPARPGGYAAPRPQVRERTFASTIFRRLQADGR
jgi:hypothetical protein